MKLIALTGKAQVGKNTTADIIKELAVGTRVKEAAFADPLKALAAKIYKVNKGLFYDSKHVVNPKHGITYRQMLTDLDDYIKTINENYWVDAMNDYFYKQKNVDLFMITDLRYAHEAKWVKSMGGYVLEVTSNRDTNLTDSEYSHKSETGINSKWVDATIPNISEFSDLRHQAALALSYINVLKN